MYGAIVISLRLLELAKPPKKASVLTKLKVRWALGYSEAAYSKLAILTRRRWYDVDNSAHATTNDLRTIGLLKLLFFLNIPCTPFS